MDYVTEVEKTKKTVEKVDLEKALEGQAIPVKDYVRPEKEDKPKKEELTEKLEKELVKKEEIKEEVNYDTMTLTELKAVAKEKGLKGYSTLKKEELIKAINENK